MKNEFIRAVNKLSSQMKNLLDLNYLREHELRFSSIYSAMPKNKEFARVLEIGTSDFSILLARLLPTYEIHTIDKTASWSTKMQMNNISFKRCNLEQENIPYPDNFFDVVIFAEVLEHLYAFPDKVFNEIRRILKPNGLLIFTTPNAASVYNRLKLLLGINPVDMITENPDLRGHVREHTLRECKNILMRTKFEIQTARYARYRDTLSCIYQRKRTVTDSSGNLIRTPKYSKLQKVIFTPLFLLNYFTVLLLPPMRRDLFLTARKK